MVKLKYSETPFKGAVRGFVNRANSVTGVNNSYVIIKKYLTVK